MPDPFRSVLIVTKISVLFCTESFTVDSGEKDTFTFVKVAGPHWAFHTVKASSWGEAWYWCLNPSLPHFLELTLYVDHFVAAGLQAIRGRFVAAVKFCLHGLHQAVGYESATSTIDVLVTHAVLLGNVITQRRNQRQ